MYVALNVVFVYDITEHFEITQLFHPWPFHISNTTNNPTVTMVENT